MSTQIFNSTADNRLTLRGIAEPAGGEKNKSKKFSPSASIEVQAGSLSIFQPATGATESCENHPGQVLAPLGSAAVAAGVMADVKAKAKAPDQPPADGNSCQWCERVHPHSLPMRQCYLCGFRVCLECLPLHHGMHNPKGGDKCSKCLYGYLLPE